MTAANLPRAVVLGDSQLQGLQAYLRDALADDMQLVSVNAIPGISTRLMIDQGKIHSVVASQHPDIVLFVLGGNDTANAAYRGTLNDAVIAVGQASPGAHIIWVGPSVALDADVDVRHHAVTDAQRDFLPPLGVSWIDARGYANHGWGPDNVHFTNGAYEEQAHALASRIHRVLHPAQPLAMAALVAGGILAIGGIGYALHRALS